MPNIFRPPIIQPIKRRSQLVDLWYGGNNLLGTTLAPAAAGDPFYQLDWPNPQKVKSAVNLQWENNLLESTLFQRPFALYDWPNSQRRVYAAALWYEGNNLLETTLGGVPEVPIVTSKHYFVHTARRKRGRG